MKPEPQEIEVEIVESIDTVPARHHPQESQPRDQQTAGSWNDWRQWRGRVRTIDMRWWPLWALIALISLIPLIVLAVITALCLIALRIVGRWFGGSRR